MYGDFSAETGANVGRRKSHLTLDVNMLPVVSSDFVPSGIFTIIYLKFNSLTQKVRIKHNYESIITPIMSQLINNPLHGRQTYSAIQHTSKPLWNLNIHRHIKKNLC
jgi:hypothetical protein